jgi:hypothetical protein
MFYCIIIYKVSPDFFLFLNFVIYRLCKKVFRNAGLALEMKGAIGKVSSWNADFFIYIYFRFKFHLIHTLK